MPHPSSRRPSSPHPSERLAGLPAARALALLRCPVCAGSGGSLAGGPDAPLDLNPTGVACSAGHTFNIARQGYLSLLSGKPPTSGDDAEMVAARHRFLTTGAYAPLRATIAEVVATHTSTSPAPVVADVGCGTGYYMAAVMDAAMSGEAGVGGAGGSGVGGAGGSGASGALGVAFDSSTFAVRHVAKAHPHVLAFTWDVFRDFPLRSGCVDVIVDVFSPRNAPEFHRVLAPGGVAVVVTPTQEHLRELRERTPMVGIDPRKEDRLRTTFADFDLVESTPVEFTVDLTPDTARDLIAMTPSARHMDPATVPGEVLPEVATTSAIIHVWQKRAR